MNAVIAAVYAVLTIGLSPISYGPIQVRLSECMVLLAFYNRKWIPGLTIGCLLANLNSPFWSDRHGCGNHSHISIPPPHAVCT